MHCYTLTYVQRSLLWLLFPCYMRVQVRVGVPLVLDGSATGSLWQVKETCAALSVASHMGGLVATICMAIALMLVTPS